VWEMDQIHLFPPQGCRNLDMLGNAITASRGRDDTSTRSKRRHPFLMTGTSQHGQMNVGSGIEATQKSAQIGADAEIGQFPSIQRQTQCHAAIVALIANTFWMVLNE